MEYFCLRNHAAAGLGFDLIKRQSSTAPNIDFQVAGHDPYSEQLPLADSRSVFTFSSLISSLVEWIGSREKGILVKVTKVSRNTRLQARHSSSNLGPETHFV